MRCLQRWSSFHPAQRNLRHGNGNPTLHVPLRLRLPSFGDDEESRVTALYFPGTDTFLPVGFLAGQFHVARLPSPIGHFLSRLATPLAQFLIALVVETHTCISWTPISLSLPAIFITLSLKLSYITHSRSHNRDSRPR